MGAFLRQVPDGSRVYLLGDVFDMCACPHDVRPVGLDRFFSGGPVAAVWTFLDELSSRASVAYLVGNHDRWIESDMLPPKVRWLGTELVERHYEFEHGHARGMFCSDDPAVPDGVPIGYFLTRLAATADRDVGTHGLSRAEVVRERVEAGMNREALPEMLIDVMARKAKVGPDDAILMPSYLWGGRITSVRELWGLYEGLVGRWESKHGALAVVTGIAAECGHLWPAAEVILAEGSLKTVIMGHTHEEAILSGVGRTYANCGAWVDSVVPTWIEISGGEVRLRTWTA